METHDTYDMLGIVSAPRNTWHTGHVGHGFSPSKHGIHDMLDQPLSHAHTRTYDRSTTHTVAITFDQWVSLLFMMNAELQSATADTASAAATAAASCDGQRVARRQSANG